MEEKGLQERPRRKPFIKLRNGQPVFFIFSPEEYIGDDYYEKPSDEKPAAKAVPALAEVLQQIQASDAPLVWKKVAARLARKIGAPKYVSWLGRLTPAEISDERLKLLAPTTFIADWVKQFFLDDIEEALAIQGLRPRIEILGLQGLRQAHAPDEGTTLLHDRTRAAVGAYLIMRARQPFMRASARV